MSEPTVKPLIFVMGHPLVDMQVTNGGEALLEKYGLQPNDGIQAEDRHMSIYEEIARDYKPIYAAGGTGNAARAAAYILPPGTVVYTGCTGDDALREQLSTANAREGVLEYYDIKKDMGTGACAVIITGHHRSMVTSLRAAQHFSRTWLEKPHIASLIDSAKVFYMEGYWLTHDTDGLLYLAEKSAKEGKTFALNISAPFVPQFYKSELDRCLAVADIVVCNEAEARAWALAEGLQTDDVLVIVRALASFRKANVARSRLAIITQGARSTVVFSSNWEEPNIYPVPPVEESQIIDTNGAGDAFVGGFLAAYALGKHIDLCIDVAHKLGSMTVQMVGPQFKWPKVQILSE
ncbi:adenosine kinase [Peniophora sp. CONT]|nr:adenosine kinase [Peniophora sp. CONT]